ncbi:MAG: DUF1987 domain-containing protein [Bacteroidetes bacterium]|nr:MAG: DUF1987 domain-containing protein [Bacteroidota bacterium]TAG87152.1 MAG: DUF1987 domain-containing protein [Bacteroidota bacterium]
MQNTLFISQTKITPEVKFEPNGSLYWNGEAFPEDAPTFFQPVLAWLRGYIKSEYVQIKNTKTYFKSKLLYFNSGARPYILNAIKLLNELAQTGHRVEIDWEYDMAGDIDEDDINFPELLENFSIHINYILNK